MTRIIPSNAATAGSVAAPSQQQQQTLVEISTSGDQPIPKEVDVLILGAGWTSTFLIPLLEEEKLSYAATTRDGV